ncbi:MAG: methionyl-tRNA formyltransferase, partial [Gemmatimonadetes bacterium]|nr:methionyl-tRNA formyltransferase [Gemmatimonadota bacterium]
PRGSSHGAGEVLAIDEAGMLVACGGGALRITAVQPAGKRRLSPLEWANGRGIAVGDHFDTAAPASP